MAKAREIPNRDLVLTWRQTAETIEEATFTHTGDRGNFFTLILQPPQRVDQTQAVPRELVFVLDTSGSMRGKPIDKAKEVMAIKSSNLDQEVQELLSRLQAEVVHIDSLGRVLDEFAKQFDGERGEGEKQHFLLVPHRPGGFQYLGRPGEHRRDKIESI